MTRLIDVFILGPMQILISTYVRNPFLKVFMFVVGLSSILYNGHNYLYLERGVIPNLIPGLNTQSGKTQIHRLYNLVVMYPLFLVVLVTQPLPPILKVSLAVNIVVGVMYNYNNYVRIE